MRISSLVSAPARAAPALPPAPAPAAPIPPPRLSADVKVLADAKLAGRAPGGPGEAGTLDYIVSQFKAAGLKPAGDNGGWTQAVPLIRLRVTPASTHFAV